MDEQPGLSGLNGHGAAPAPTRLAIRTRLAATFLALLLLTAVIAITGIAGMLHNQRALNDFEAGVMPEIARVLELAEKVAQLAAVAPSVAEAEMLSPNSDDRQLAHELLQEIRRLSDNLPTQADSRLEASVMLDGIDRDLTSLLALSGERKRLQDELQLQRSMLDQIGDRLYREREQVDRRGATLQAIWSTLVAAVMTDEYLLLGRAEADVEALWLHAQSVGEDQLMPDVADQLRQLSEGDYGLFQLRRQLLRSERSVNTVLQLTRSHSSQLNTRASAYVAELRKVATQRRDAVRSAVTSGASALVLVSGLSVLTAIGGALYGRRVLHELQSMTQLMTRLAGGDVGQPTPAIERRDEIGELARAFQVFRDHLLEKQRLTLGLHAQSQLIENVFHSMNDGLAVFDAEGRLVVWNQKFASLLSFAGDRFRPGMSVLELNAALPKAASWQVLSEETAVTVSGHRVPSSKELLLPGSTVLEFLSHPMPEGGWVEVCRDLTARRTIEAQLHQAQRMEVLGQLTGGVAHDFNNFLSAVLGNLELLSRRLNGNEALGGLAARAHKAAESAAGLSRRLLVFARRQQLEVESVSVGDMLAEMADLIEYSVGPAIRVHIEEGDPALSVQVDRGQLENAILNLALNSAAAMPGGGSLRIEVGTVAQSHRVVPPGAAVVIRVSDTGHGMPPHVQARVLEPFFTTKAPGHGTGLGLAIVDGFVRQCNGTLSVHSTEGVGTTIELWLPAARATSPLAHVHTVLQVLSDRNLQVLVVEDDPSVRATAALLFEDLGVTVDQASSEDQAIDRLRQHGPYSLVLSDVMLGSGGDGIALYHRVKASWPQQRMALTSGMPPEVHAKRDDWPGEVVFVQKPFSGKSLAALLTTVE